MDYVEAAQARTLPGLKVALTAGVPGPWSEAVKMMFNVKGIAFIPVVQHAGQANDDLVAWTGCRNAPVIVADDHPPLTGWLEQLMFIERSAPSPALLPDDRAERAAVIGLIHELAGEDGFGWCRRLMSFSALAKLMPTPAQPDPTFVQMMKAYRISDAEAQAAPRKIAAILKMLASRLQAQAEQGSPYLVGHTLTAADIFWATFSQQLEPMPPELNPMPDLFRSLFTVVDPEILSASDPILIRHRDFIYDEHLSLPLDY